MSLPIQTPASPTTASPAASGAAAASSSGQTSAAPAAASPDGGDSSSIWGKDGFSFHDLLDIINPLDHIPVIGGVIRAITHQDIAPASRVIGDTLFGGPIGLVTSVAELAYEHFTGKDPEQQIASALKGGSQSNVDALRKMYAQSGHEPQMIGFPEDKPWDYAIGQEEAAAKAQAQKGQTQQAQAQSGQDPNTPTATPGPTAAGNAPAAAPPLQLAEASPPAAPADSALPIWLRGVAAPQNAAAAGAAATPVQAPAQAQPAQAPAQAQAPAFPAHGRLFPAGRRPTAMPSATAMPTPRQIYYHLPGDVPSTRAFEPAPSPAPSPAPNPATQPAPASAMTPAANPVQMGNPQANAPQAGQAPASTMPGASARPPLPAAMPAGTPTPSLAQARAAMKAAQATGNNWFTDAMLQGLQKYQAAQKLHPAAGAQAAGAQAAGTLPRVDISQ